MNSDAFFEFYSGMVSSLNDTFRFNIGFYYWSRYSLKLDSAFIYKVNRDGGDSKGEFKLKLFLL